MFRQYLPAHRRPATTTMRTLLVLVVALCCTQALGGSVGRESQKMTQHPEAQTETLTETQQTQPKTQPKTQTPPPPEPETKIASASDLLRALMDAMQETFSNLSEFISGAGVSQDTSKLLTELQLDPREDFHTYRQKMNLSLRTKSEDIAFHLEQLAADLKTQAESAGDRVREMMMDASNTVTEQMQELRAKYPGAVRNYEDMIGNLQNSTQMLRVKMEELGAAVVEDAQSVQQKFNEVTQNAVTKIQQLGTEIKQHFQQAAQSSEPSQ